MNRLTITCASCGETWMVAGTFSLYEQQAVESRPCPHCGAYTLSLPEPEDRTEGVHAHAAHGRRRRRPLRLGRVAAPRKGL